MYNSPSNDTQTTVAKLIQSKDKYFDIAVMNVQRQTNSVDCGLHAVAMLASLLLGQDPTTIVYSTEELCLHLTKILEEKKISLFPTIKTRKHATRVTRVEECHIYCICRLPDCGQEDMICCDHCDEWFHSTCLNIFNVSLCGDKWYCNDCTHKEKL